MAWKSGSVASFVSRKRPCILLPDWISEVEVGEGSSYKVVAEDGKYSASGDFQVAICSLATRLSWAFPPLSNWRWLGRSLVVASLYTVGAVRFTVRVDVTRVVSLLLSAEFLF